jgi:hypothetical protein
MPASPKYPALPTLNEEQRRLLREYMNDALGLASELQGVEQSARELEAKGDALKYLANSYCRLAAYLRLVRPLHSRCSWIVHRLYLGSIHPPIKCGGRVEQTAAAAIRLCAFDVLQPNQAMLNALYEHIWTEPLKDPDYPIRDAPCPPAYKQQIEQILDKDWRAIGEWWRRTPDLGVEMARGYLVREQTALRWLYSEAQTQLPAEQLDPAADGLGADWYRINVGLADSRLEWLRNAGKLCVGRDCVKVGKRWRYLPMAVRGALNDVDDIEALDDAIKRLGEKRPSRI